MTTLETHCIDAETRMHALPFAGQLLHLHGDKLLWLPALRLLCVSDIHFEKGSFFSKFGTLLPPYDTRETLQRLERHVAAFQPELFIALGDSFHDKAAVARLEPELRERLNALVARVPRWLWVMGNHDPEIGAAIGGERCVETRQGGIRFRHETQGAGEEPEISGHYHPKASVSLRSGRLSAPCFVQSGQRLIMPAFGSYTGGLFVHDAAFTAVMPAVERRIFLVHRGQVHEV